MDTLVEQIEMIEARLSDQMFRRITGLDSDADRIAALNAELKTLYLKLANLVQHDEPAMDAVAQALMWRHTLSEYEEVMAGISRYLRHPTRKVGDQPVTFFNLPTFEASEDSHAMRQEVRQHLMDEATHIVDSIDGCLARQREVAAEYGRTPLDCFCRAEGLDEPTLRSLIETIGDQARPAFERLFPSYARRILGEDTPADFTDLMALCRNRDMQLCDPFVGGVNLVEVARRTIQMMGFDPERITMDVEARPAKFPSALVMAVRPPHDVRISVLPSGGFNMLCALLHELGHAVHYSSLEPNLPLWKRRPDFGTAETFSNWLEMLLEQPSYLRAVLGFNEEQVAEALGVARLRGLIIMTWRSALSLSVVDFWSGAAPDFAALEERLREYGRRFTGLEVPEGYAPLDHFARNATFNVVGFPVAYARLGHIYTQLEAGEAEWWCRPEAINELKGYMKRGRDAGFPTEWLDPEAILARYVHPNVTG